MPLHLNRGDITGFAGDSVVNAANESLLAGGGVCGAIHKAAGPGLERYCRNLAPCPAGQCVLSPAFNMRCCHVIHAVGPRWFGGSRGEADILRQTYRNIFLLVGEKEIVSVALPAISTGIFGYPLDEATAIAVHAALSFLVSYPDVDVHFYCFDEKTHACYQKAIQEAGVSGPQGAGPGSTPHGPRS